MARVVMDRSLYPHQREMLAWAQQRDTIALFVQMRLGKTPVTIRWAHDDRAVLVVAPLSTLSRYGWSRELELEHVRPVHRLYEIPNKRRRAFMRQTSLRGWFLINYEGLRVAPWLLSLDWSTIVLDESTKIRTPRAQITKLLTKCTAHIRRRAILTGLPNPESPLDYFTQFQFLHGDFLGSTNYYQFRHRHYQQVTYDWVPRRGAIGRIKGEVHLLAFVLTRAEVGLGNHKDRQVRVVPCAPAVARLQRQVLQDFACGDLETKWSPVQQTWLAKLAGGYSPGNELVSDLKLRELEDLVTGELRGESLVVWFRFNHELHEAARRLAQHEPVAVIYGDTPKPERSTIQERFLAGKVRILCAQVKCGQYGMNLSRASTAIYYSNAWDYEVRAQSEDRIEHMDKHEPLLLIDLVTKGSTDEGVLAALGHKAISARTFSMRMLEEMKKLWAKGMTRRVA
jgi:SNF2 family DNA or RNA helicase